MKKGNNWIVALIAALGLFFLWKKFGGSASSATLATGEVAATQASLGQGSGTFSSEASAYGSQGVPGFFGFSHAVATPPNVKAFAPVGERLATNPSPVVRLGASNPVSGGSRQVMRMPITLKTQYNFAPVTNKYTGRAVAGG